MATPTMGSGKTILLIDDQPFFLTVQQTMLQKHGYRVVSAADGAEGLAKAKEHKLDIILLDIEMPGMDGFTVCETLKKDRSLRNIPVIILTATQDPKLNEKAFHAGAEMTVLKTVSTERLLNVLRLTLDRIKPST